MSLFFTCFTNTADTQINENILAFAHYNKNVRNVCGEIFANSSNQLDSKTGSTLVKQLKWKYTNMTLQWMFSNFSKGLTFVNNKLILLYDKQGARENLLILTY